MAIRLLLILAIPAALIWVVGYGPDRVAAVFILSIPALLALGVGLIVNRRTPPSVAAHPPQSYEPLAQSADGSFIVVAPGDKTATSPAPPGVAEGDRSASRTAYAATLLIAGAALVAGIVSPTTALAVLVIEAAWVLYWAPEATRRHILSSTVVINRDAATVFAFVSDFTNAPKYQFMHDFAVEKITDGPIGPGTRFRSHGTMSVMPAPTPRARNFDGIEEIVEFEPNRRFTARVVQAPQRSIEVTTFDEVPGGTRVTHRFEYLFSYPSAVTGAIVLRLPAVDRRMRANRVASWNRAKEILEGRQPVTP